MFAERSQFERKSVGGGSRCGVRKSNMVKAKVFAVLFMVATLVAWSGVAQAGGGGEGLPGGAVFYTCYAIHQGANPKVVLNVNDQFTDSHDIRVDKAKLLCTLATGTFVSGTEHPTPESDHLTCYETSDTAKSRALVQLQDSFGVQNVLIGRPQYVCTGSNKTCLDSGCPILDSPVP